MIQTSLTFRSSDGPFSSPLIEPLREIGAYEELWLDRKMTFARMAEKMAENPDALPSDFVAESVARTRGDETLSILRKAGIERFGVRVHGAGLRELRRREKRLGSPISRRCDIWILLCSSGNCEG